MYNVMEQEQVERLRGNLFFLMGSAASLLSMLEDKSLYDEATLVKEQLNAANKALSETANFVEIEKYQTLNPVLFDITELMRSVYNITRSKIRKSNIKVNFNSDGNKILVFCDPNRCANCFFNLIVNSLKNVDLDEGVINVSVKTCGDHVRVSVSDNGYGMTVEEANKKFYNTEKVGGFTVLRKFAEVSEGTVIFETAENCGFTVSLRIPLAKETAELHATDVFIESGAMTDADAILGKFDLSITKPL